MLEAVPSTKIIEYCSGEAMATLCYSRSHCVSRLLAIRRRRDSWTGQVFKKEVKIEEKNIITGYSSGLWKFTEKEGIFFPYPTLQFSNLADFSIC